MNDIGSLRQKKSDASFHAFKNHQGRSCCTWELIKDFSKEKYPSKKEKTTPSSSIEDGTLFNHEEHFQNLSTQFRKHIKLIRFNLADNLNAIITWYPQTSCNYCIILPMFANPFSGTNLPNDDCCFYELH